MRQTTKYNKTSNDLYDTFEGKDEVDLRTFKSILTTFNSFLTLSMITKGKIYSLPLKMGIVGIFSRDNVKGTSIIDWQYYKDTGEKVLLRNWHSQSKYVRFIWDCGHPYGFIKHSPSNAFKLEVNRDSKRLLAKLIKTKQLIHIYTDIHDK